MDFEAVGVRSYISEPDRGRRNWTKSPKARDAVYRTSADSRSAWPAPAATPRRAPGERPFAHLYDTGGRRRVYLRGHTNIRKRLLIHAGGFNLGLLMRQLIGVGTPRGLQGRVHALVAALLALIESLSELATRYWPTSPLEHRSIARFSLVDIGARDMAFTTGC